MLKKNPKAAKTNNNMWRAHYFRDVLTSLLNINNKNNGNLVKSTKKPTI